MIRNPMREKYWRKKGIGIFKIKHLKIHKTMENILSLISSNRFRICLRSVSMSNVDATLKFEMAHLNRILEICFNGRKRGGLRFCSSLIANNLWRSDVTIRVVTERTNSAF